MPNKQHFSKDSSGSSRVELNFWGLLLLIATLAIASSAVAVRWHALPFLQSYQADVLNRQINDVAHKLDAKLSKHRTFLSFVAADGNVVSLTMGVSSNADYVPDLLQGLNPPDELDWVGLYDAFGDEISEFSNKEASEHTHSEPYFAKDIIADFLETHLADETGTSRDVLMIEGNHETHIMLALPILYNGRPEGVLLGMIDLDAAYISPPHEMIEHTELLYPDSETAQDHPENTASLTEVNLMVRQFPHAKALDGIGKTLVNDTLVAISVVLFGTFSLFAVVGRSIIVEPHKKLKTQTLQLASTTATLRAQKKELSELAAIAERANDSMLVTDKKGNITWTNPAFERLTGYAFEEVVGKKPGWLLHGPDTDPTTIREISEALAVDRPVKREVLNYNKSGNPFWANLSISPLKNDDNQIVAYVAITGDISEQRRQREEIETAHKEIAHKALHDTLTDLPNRRALDSELQTRTEDNTPTTVLRIDLDHFKYVNDTLGHAAGDFALCSVANIMREEAGKNDLPARVGGDEFVVLLAPNKTSNDALDLGHRLLARIREPKNFGQKTLRFGASFGIASTIEGILKSEDLLIGADAALYEAKSLGRNRISMYTQELHDNVLAQRVLAHELRLAVVNEEFEPFFQPQFDADTKEIVGVETLARWPSPVLGMVQPDNFLRVAEQLSLVSSIDDIIFRKAIKHISTLRDEGFDINKVAFNVTAERVEDPEVLKRLKENKVEGLQIAFEILESVLIEDQGDRFKYGLDKLREEGVEIEIDDFGSGHASIVGLMQLQPDTMKVDRQLVERVIADQVSQGVLRSIVDIGKKMDLKIIAEGVETMEHAELLNEIGVHTLQGFAFCKPLNHLDLRNFITQYQPKKNHQVA